MKDINKELPSPSNLKIKNNEQENEPSEDLDDHRGFSIDNLYNNSPDVNKKRSIENLRSIVSKIPPDDSIKTEEHSSSSILVQSVSSVSSSFCNSGNQSLTKEELKQIIRDLQKKNRKKKQIKSKKSFKLVFYLLFYYLLFYYLLFIFYYNILFNLLFYSF